MDSTNADSDLPDREPEPTEGAGEAFVLRFWQDEAAAEGRDGLWRGSMTHAMSGKRRYVQSMDDIAEFISGYLRLGERNPGDTAVA